MKNNINAIKLLIFLDVSAELGEKKGIRIFYLFIKV